MKEIDVYKQYFAADCVYNEVPRKGVVVTLTAISDSGIIKYVVGLTFFPYRDPEDFMISYDAYSSQEIYSAKGRRSKKKEAMFLEELKEHADALAAEVEGTIFWEKPLTDAVWG